MEKKPMNIPNKILNEHGRIESNPVNVSNISRDYIIQIKFKIKIALSVPDLYGPDLT